MLKSAKKILVILRTCFTAIIATAPFVGAAQERCNTASLAVQVLGSGGPYVGSARASSSYLVWKDGHAVVMIDVGGGAFLRFGEAGAHLNDISLLAVSHLHPDHVSDLPALLWLSDVVRERPLNLVGPSDGGQFPDIATFVTRLFDSTSGAFPILSGTVRQTGRGTPLDITVIDVDAADVKMVLKADELEVTAIGVPHGVDAQNAVPSVAYRVKVGEKDVVFSSDQNGMDERFTRFAMGADVLVMHFAVSMRATDGLRRLHAVPTTVGRIARDAQVGRLVLSHLSDAPAETPFRESFSVLHLEENVSVVRDIFSGPIVVAEDLECIFLQ